MFENMFESISLLAKGLFLIDLQLHLLLLLVQGTSIL